MISVAHFRFGGRFLSNDRFDTVELRRYTTKPGRRDELITLFEREFLESQEACGMVPIGHYCDLTDPNAFVWYRGFPDMESRQVALDAFYVHSDAWLLNREAANATMVDSDNVLLLRPARAQSGFDLGGLRRSGDQGRHSFVAASIVMLHQAVDEARVSAFERNLLPHQIAQRVAYFVTEERANNFPRLPVREGESAFVATGACEDIEALGKWMQAFDDAGTGDPRRAEVLATEHLQLAPAPRSLF